LSKEGIRDMRAVIEQYVSSLCRFLQSRDVCKGKARYCKKKEEGFACKEK